MPETPRARIIVLTAENAESVVAPLLAHRDDVHARLEAEMTVAQAEQVKVWRVEGCTWGRIGEDWAALYPDYDGTQILGRELCYRAATLLGDDPWDRTWN